MEVVELVESPQAVLGETAMPLIHIDIPSHIADLCDYYIEQRERERDNVRLSNVANKLHNPLPHRISRSSVIMEIIKKGIPLYISS